MGLVFSRSAAEGWGFAPAVSQGIIPSRSSSLSSILEVAARSEMVKGKLAHESTVQELGTDYSKELERAGAKMQQAGVKLGSIQTSVQFAVERRANLEKVTERRRTVWKTTPESGDALLPTVERAGKASEAVSQERESAGDERTARRW